MPGAIPESQAEYVPLPQSSSVVTSEKPKSSIKGPDSVTEKSVSKSDPQYASEPKDQKKGHAISKDNFTFPMQDHR